MTRKIISSGGGRGETKGKYRPLLVTSFPETRQKKKNYFLFSNGYHTAFIFFGRGKHKLNITIIKLVNPPGKPGSVGSWECTAGYRG